MEGVQVVEACKLYAFLLGFFGTHLTQRERRFETPT